MTRSTTLVPLLSLFSLFQLLLGSVALPELHPSQNHGMAFQTPLANARHSFLVEKEHTSCHSPWTSQKAPQTFGRNRIVCQFKDMPKDFGDGDDKKDDKKDGGDKMSKVQQAALFYVTRMQILLLEKTIEAQTSGKFDGKTMQMMETLDNMVAIQRQSSTTSSGDSSSSFDAKEEEEKETTAASSKDENISLGRSPTPTIPKEAETKSEEKTAAASTQTKTDADTTTTPPADTKPKLALERTGNAPAIPTSGKDESAKKETPVKPKTETLPNLIKETEKAVPKMNLIKETEKAVTPKASQFTEPVTNKPKPATTPTPVKEEPVATTGKAETEDKATAVKKEEAPLASEPKSSTTEAAEEPPAPKFFEARLPACVSTEFGQALPVAQEGLPPLRKPIVVQKSSPSDKASAETKKEEVQEATKVPVAVATPPVPKMDETKSVKDAATSTVADTPPSLAEAKTPNESEQDGASKDEKSTTVLITPPPADTKGDDDKDKKNMEASKDEKAPSVLITPPPADEASKDEKAVLITPPPPDASVDNDKDKKDVEAAKDEKTQAVLITPPPKEEETKATTPPAAPGTSNESPSEGDDKDDKVDKST